MLALRWLVRIRRRSDGNGLVLSGYSIEEAFEGLGRPSLHIDLRLEVLPFLEIKKTVSVAGITVRARELAASVGVDGPDERKPRVPVAVEDVPDRKVVVFDSSPALHCLRIRVWPANGRKSGKKSQLAVKGHNQIL